MEQFSEFNIELFLCDLDCDVRDLIGIVQEKLKELHVDQLNSSKQNVDTCFSFIKNTSDSARNYDIKKECLMTDPRIPEGWKTQTFTKEGQQRTHYLSPDGASFRSKKQAYKHMLAVGYSHKIIRDMRNFLALDGWMEDSIIPKDWLFKRTNKFVYFLTEDGTFLGTVKEAQAHLHSNKYNNQYASD